MEDTDDYKNNCGDHGNWNGKVEFRRSRDSSSFQCWTSRGAAEEEEQASVKEIFPENQRKEKKISGKMIGGNKYK